MIAARSICCIEKPRYPQSIATRELQELVFSQATVID